VVPGTGGGSAARARLRVIVRRILRKHGYPPDKQEQATRTVLQQLGLLLRAKSVIASPTHPHVRRFGLATTASGRVQPSCVGPCAVRVGVMNRSAGATAAVPLAKIA